MDEILRQIIIRITKVFKADISDTLANNLLQFVKFGIVGFSNTVISYILNIVTLVVLRPFEMDWDYIVANLVAFMLSVLWSFFWNSRYVFVVESGEDRSIFRTLVKTYISYAFTGIVLNNILSWLWIEKFGVSKYIAPVINLIVSVPINFIINKLWAFKTHK